MSTASSKLSSTTSGGPKPDRQGDDAVALSVVAPCYNEQEVAREFHRRATAAVNELRITSYEIILVDDGSSDRTWSIIESIASTDAHVIGMRLMRNHGHQLAATAGLQISRGGRVLLIDADLQDPPELLGDMMAAMDGGADVVYGLRAVREGETWFKSVSASAFYRLLSKIAAVSIPKDTGDFRLMSRRVVDALGLMPERQRFIRGMVSWIGGQQVALPYERQARFAGQSKYPISRMLRFAIDAITSFSAVPLRMASYFGFLTAFVALLLLVYTIWRWSVGDAVVGWSSVMTAIVLFSAVQLIVLGIIGEYLGRLFQEAKARPLFLVDIVIAGKSEHVLPANFCSLDPAVRQDVWKAIQAADGVGSR